MSKAILQKYAAGLSLANVTADSVSVSEFDSDNFRIVLPTPTFDAVDQYAHDLLDGKTESFYAKNPDAWDEVVGEFDDSDGHSEWEQSFFPMMLYYWPVAIDSDTSEETAADLMEAVGIACSLIAIEGEALREVVGEDHAIVLTGGGMNLCDHIVAAYLACGAVPPARLLTGLKGVIGKRMLERIAPRLRQAFESSASYLTGALAEVRRTKKGLFSKTHEGINPHA